MLVFIRDVLKGKNPVSPNPLNLRGADSPPKFRGRRVQNPLFESVFGGPPRKFRG